MHSVLWFLHGTKVSTENKSLHSKIYSEKGKKYTNNLLRKPLKNSLPQ